MRRAFFVLSLAAVLAILPVVARCQALTDAAMLKAKALECLDLGNVGGAAAVIVELTTKYPNSTEVFDIGYRAPYEARLPLRNFLASEPSGKLDAFSTQWLIAELGEDDESGAVVERLLPKAQGKTRLLQALVSIARFHKQLIVIYKQMLDLQPDKPQIGIDLAEFYLNDHQPTAAADVARYLKGKFPQNSNVAKSADNILEKCRQWDERARALPDISVLDPNKDGADILKLADKYRDAGRGSDAAQSLEALISRSKVEDRPSLALAALVQIREDAGDAEKLADVVVRFDESRPVRASTSTIWIILQKYSREPHMEWNRKLAVALERITPTHPRAVATRIAMCELYNECGETTKALELFEKLRSESKIDDDIFQSFATYMGGSNSAVLALVLRRLAELEPSNLEIWERLARTEAAVGMSDKALATVRQMQDRWANDSNEASNWYQSDGSANDWNLSLVGEGKWTNSVEVAFFSASVLKTIGRCEEAADIYRTEAKTFPKYAGKCVDLAADGYENAGKFQESVTLRRNYVSSQPSLSERRRILALILNTQTAANDYVEQAKTIVEIDSIPKGFGGPASLSPYGPEGNWLMRTRDKSALADVLLKEVEGKTDLVTSRFILLDLLKAGKRVADMETVAMQMIDNPAVSVYSLDGVKRDLNEAGSKKCDEAILKRQCELHPDDPNLVLSLMGIYVFNKRKAEAAECGRIILQKWPENGSALYTVGQYFSSLEMWAEAADAFTNALARGATPPMDSMPWLAQVCEKGNRRDSALALYRKIIAKADETPPRFPGMPFGPAEPTQADKDGRREEGYRGIVHICLASAHYDEAAKTLIEAESTIKDPNRVYGLVFAGDPEVRNERFAASLRRALRGRNGYPVSLRLLAQIYSQLGKGKDALPVIEKVRKMARGKTDVLGQIAEMCLWDKALYSTGFSICREVLAAEPNNRQCVGALFILYQNSGAKNEGMRKALQMRDMPGADSSTLAIMGEWLTHLAQWDEAIKAYQKAIAAIPEPKTSRQGDVDTYTYDIAEVYRKAGRNVEAESMAREVLARTKNLYLRSYCRTLLAKLGKL